MKLLFCVLCWFFFIGNAKTLISMWTRAFTHTHIRTKLSKSKPLQLRLKDRLDVVDEVPLHSSITPSTSTGRKNELFFNAKSSWRRLQSKQSLQTNHLRITLLLGQNLTCVPKPSDLNPLNPWDLAPLLQPDRRHQVLSLWQRKASFPPAYGGLIYIARKGN